MGGSGAVRCVRGLECRTRLGRQQKKKNRFYAYAAVSLVMDLRDEKEHDSDRRRRQQPGRPNHPSAEDRRDDDQQLDRENSNTVSVRDPPSNNIDDDVVFVSSSYVDDAQSIADVYGEYSLPCLREAQSIARRDAIDAIECYVKCEI